MPINIRFSMGMKMPRILIVFYCCHNHSVILSAVETSKEAEKIIEEDMATFSQRKRKDYEYYIPCKDIMEWG